MGLMFSGGFNRYGDQTEESETTRNYQFAKNLVVLRIAAVGVAAFECWLMGDAAGLVIMIICMLIWILWFKLQEKPEKILPVKALWFELWFIFFLAGIVATVIWLFGWWPKFEWKISGHLTWYLVHGVAKWSMPMWIRVVVIVFLPVVCYVPWLIIDWVIRMELEQPNTRNATPERMSIDGVQTPRSELIVVLFFLLAVRNRS